MTTTNIARCRRHFLGTGTDRRIRIDSDGCRTRKGRKSPSDTRSNVRSICALDPSPKGARSTPRAREAFVEGKGLPRDTRTHTRTQPRTRGARMERACERASERASERQTESERAAERQGPIYIYRESAPLRRWPRRCCAGFAAARTASAPAAHAASARALVRCMCARARSCACAPVRGACVCAGATHACVPCARALAFRTSE